MKIEINHLNFAYKDKLALQDISLSIQSHDLAVILGPNGSGKSTLLKCIVSILKAQKGSITIDDIDQQSYTPRQLSQLIAYIPQSEVATMELNVFDTVMMGRKPFIEWRATHHDILKTEEVLKELELEELAFRSMHTLSGGERQRVYIARAMVQEPKILLLDEPTANLDIYHQLKVMRLLQQLAASGITVILTEHDINMAARYANKVIMLRSGKVFNCGDSSIFTVENIRHLYDIHVSIQHLQNHIYIIPEKIVK